MVTMAQSVLNWCKTHALMDRTHSVTHFTSTQLQLRCAKRQFSYYFLVYAGSFRVNYMIFNVHTCSFLCVRITRVLGKPTVA